MTECQSNVLSYFLPPIYFCFLDTEMKKEILFFNFKKVFYSTNINQSHTIYKKMDTCKKYNNY